jgi:hypothetical protein
MDETRLMDFAGHLASRGYAVLNPGLPDFRRYHVTPRTTSAELRATWRVVAFSAGMLDR